MANVQLARLQGDARQNHGALAVQIDDRADAVGANPDSSAAAIDLALMATAGLVSAVERASLGIAGGKAYAVAGPDLEEGEAVFVAIRRKPGEPLHEAQRRAAHQALEKLEQRLGCQLIYFWTPHAPVARG